MSKLHIGEGLSLPLDAVTQKFAFLGRTGSGKTYAAGKLVEEMLARGAQVVIVDPVGAWWGLRLAADGKSPGISIPVFGGLHGDVPLEVNSGQYMADMITSHGTSAVLDISQFESDADKVRFLEPFGNRFFFRKKQAPGAVHLVIEESQEVVPQNPQKGEERMLHAYSRIEKLGRNFGIGVSLISQRPQEINKKALNQTECMFAFQMTAPQERKAVKEWIQEKGLDVDIVEILPRLKQGIAHVWSPTWIEVSAEFVIGEKWTFNASATPEVGKKAVARELAPIDLERIRGEMAATIERAKQEDPKELRRQIADLKRQVAAKPKPEVDDQAIQSAVESAIAQRDKEFRVQAQEYVKVIDRMQSALASIGKAAADYVSIKLPKESHQPIEISLPPRRVQPPRPAAILHSRREVQHRAERREPGEKLRAGAERMLAALVQWHPEGMREGQMRAHAGMKRSGTFTTYLSDLRTGGYIEESGGMLYATAAGREYFGGSIPDSPRTTEEVLDIWEPKLRQGARRILRVLVSKNGEAMRLEELAAEAGMVKSGTFTTYLSDLRTARLIVTERGVAAANRETLFL